MNPLLESFDTAPFSKIKNADYQPAIKKAIAISKEEIKRIVKIQTLQIFKIQWKHLSLLDRNWIELSVSSTI